MSNFVNLNTAFSNFAKRKLHLVTFIFWLSCCNCFLKKEIQKFNIGLFNKKLNDFGPLVSKEHRKNVIKLIDSAEKEGSKILIDGRKNKEGEKDLKNGYFLGATLIDNVKVSMKSYKEEIFGPVLQIVRVKTFEDGLDNKKRYF